MLCEDLDGGAIDKPVSSDGETSVCDSQRNQGICPQGAVVGCGW